MEHKLKLWWDRTVNVLEAMDSSPVADLYVEVARLRLEVQ